MDDKMQFSPKLKKAMAEIKEILDKHDIAGAVFLHTPGHGEHMLKVDPSYSCAFWNFTPGEEGIRVRTRLQEDYGGDTAKRNQAQTDTVNMFSIFADMMGPHAIGMIDMLEMLGKHFDIDEEKGGATSQTTQDN